MKWIIGLLFVVIVLLVLYTYTGAQRITSEEAKRRIFDKIVDVRTDFEYSSGHYPNAIHLPAGSFTPSAAENAGLKKTDTILVYCNTGQRARRAAETLKSYGYPNVVYIAGTYDTLF